ncbi:MAG TPA: BlaI/MecI/CopY family transcriptional regulator [Acidobacteriaceae bacterium]|jgi:predicted transcriptional regulator
MTERKPSAGPHSQRPAEFGNGASATVLGRREREVLAVLRELGSATVQQVVEHLDASLAYTTVMTTLDRLFRKGLLEREKVNRAFLYSPSLSARDLEEQRAAHLIRRFFSESDSQPDVLVSCLVDAVHDYNTDLLDQLESSIRSARGQPHPSRSKKEGRP